MIAQAKHLEIENDRRQRINPVWLVETLFFFVYLVSSGRKSAISSPFTCEVVVHSRDCLEIAYDAKLVYLGKFS